MLQILLFLSFAAHSAGTEVRAQTPTLSAVLRPTSTTFKSYKEWKNDQMAYWHSKGQIEMARGLTVADYFAGYLTKQKDQAQAIREVSRKLSADEVAELMTIYANSVFGTTQPQLPATATATNGGN